MRDVGHGRDRRRPWLLCALALLLLAAAWWSGWLRWDAAPVQMAGSEIADEATAVATAPPDLATQRLERTPVAPDLALPGALPALRPTDGEPARLRPLGLDRFFEARDDAACECEAKGYADDRVAAELIACRAISRAIAPKANQAEVEGVTSGRVAYDPMAAARCLLVWKSCPEPGSEADACDSVFRGLVPAGGSCHDDVDCVVGGCRKTSVADVEGVCGSKDRLGARCESLVDCIDAPYTALQCIDGTCQARASTVGAACEYSCGGDDLWCDKSATPHRCRQTLGLDRPCELGGDSCAAPLVCRQVSGESRCRPRSGVDEACDEERHPLDQCAEGLRCVAMPGGGKCRPGAALGEPCNGDAQCPFPSTYCRGGNASSVGQCVGKPVEGEPCIDRLTDDARCRAPFVCHLGRQRCVTELAEGDPCDNFSCGGLNQRFTCVAGVCRARLPLGAACEPEPGAEDAPSVVRCAPSLRCVSGRCAAR